MTHLGYWPQQGPNHSGPCGGLVHLLTSLVLRGFPGGSDVKESACNAWDLSSIPKKFPWSIKFRECYSHFCLYLCSFRFTVHISILKSWDLWWEVCFDLKKALHGINCSWNHEHLKEQHWEMMAWTTGSQTFWLQDLFTFFSYWAPHPILPHPLQRAFVYDS